jgi:hypothetical protein
MSLKTNILTRLDNILAQLNTVDGARILNRAIQVGGRRRIALDPTDPQSQTISEYEVYLEQVSTALNDTFKSITGTDLFQPFSLFKADWLSKVLASELWNNIEKFGFQGQNQNANYLLVFRDLIIELRDKVLQYKELPPQPTEPGEPGAPIITPPGTPTPPPPGTPPAPAPGTQKINPALIALGLGSIFLLSKI